MIATADSKIINKIWVRIKILIIHDDKIGPVLPNKVINKWPATILAISRIANVIGRIIFLIVSIQTIKGIKIGGVPWGIIWANMWVMLLIHPYNMNVNQRGRASDNVKIKWLVLVKI